MRHHPPIPRACDSIRPSRSVGAAWLCVALSFCLPAGAAAQTATGAPRLPRADVVALTGTFHGDRDDLHADHGTWDVTGLASVGGGFYWTEHLKTEIDAGISGERETYSVETIGFGNQARFFYREHTVTTRTLSLTQQYQFLHNTWVHPFLGAGLDLDWEQRHATLQEPVQAPDRTVSTHALQPRAALTGGIKAYFTRRAFVRTDLRVSFAGTVDAVRWRIGAGVDF